MQSDYSGERIRKKGKRGVEWTKRGKGKNGEKWATIIDCWSGARNVYAAHLNT